MVFKEEILTWFKDLDSYKRIDIICELISMCIPFEMRFIGSYLEEHGRHSYQELRQQTLAANDVDKLEKDALLKNQSLHEETVRHRVLVNISLLKSRNYSVANWYSRKFLRTEYIEDMIQKEKDDVVQNELLLLFTMAARHPAFSFDQKQFFSRILVMLCDIRDSRFINKAYSTHGYPPGFGYPTLYRKVHDGSPLPMGIPMHPLGLPHLDFMTHFRSWPGLSCGAPAEVPPFPPHQQPMQPPQPSTSPLVSSPSQSRSSSPHRTPMVSRPPTLSIITTPAPTMTIPPPVNPQGVLPPSAPGLPPPGTGVAGTPLVLPPPGAPVTPMMPVPMDALAPPPAQLSQSSQLSPIYGQQETDELNTTLKGEDSSKPPMINPWMINTEPKQINGMRIPPFPPNMIRTSLADHMHSMTLTDESSHYQSSSSNSSPLQTPPDTPSNLPSNVSTPHGPGRGLMDKNRVNGLPTFMPPFGDTTSPPPPPAFTFPTYAPMPPARYYTSAGFRPPVTTVFGQYAAPPPPPGQQYHQGPCQVQAAVTETASFPPATTYSIPYFSYMYSSVPPAAALAAAPLPPRNPPGCYNCGACAHLGQDCPQQNIEEITQKKTYSVDFSPVQSDGGEK